MFKSMALALCLAGMLIPGARGADSLPIAEFEGHVVWLDFWASWCAPCRQSFPWMQQMQERYRQRGLMVVAVNLDHDRLAADRFLSGFAHDFTVRFDPAGELPRQFKVHVMPTSVLLDAHGEVLARHAGFKPIDQAQYESEIEKSLSRSVP